MRKINKIITLALIFMLIGGFLLVNPTYSMHELRVPLDGSNRIGQLMDAAVKKNMIFASPKGGFEVLPYSAQNFAKYKQGILDIAKGLPEISLDVISSLPPGSANLSYIAIVDGKVAGFIVCLKTSRGILFVGNIAVHEGYKRRGIGNILLLAALEKAQS